MATFQVRYGCVIAETEIDTTATFDEGTTMQLDTSTGKWKPTVAATGKFRIVYTGYPSTRPDVTDVGKVKAVLGPGIIETDVISGAVGDYTYGDEISAKAGMITALDTTAIGFVADKSTTTLTIQLY